MVAQLPPEQVVATRTLRRVCLGRVITFEMPFLSALDALVVAEPFQLFRGEGAVSCSRAAVGPSSSFSLNGVEAIIVVVVGIVSFLLFFVIVAFFIIV